MHKIFSHKTRRHFFRYSFRTCHHFCRSAAGFSEMLEGFCFSSIHRR